MNTEVITQVQIQKLLEEVKLHGYGKVVVEFNIQAGAITRVDISKHYSIKGV